MRVRAKGRGTGEGYRCLLMLQSWPELQIPPTAQAHRLMLHIPPTAHRLMIHIPPMGMPASDAILTGSRRGLSSPSRGRVRVRVKVNLLHHYPT